MAVYTVSNAGGNYNVGATWVGGIVPSTTDTVAFTPTSGNLTVSAVATCAGIDFTNYVGTITVNATFTINGNINLGTGGYTAGGSNTMYIGATGTITSNGTIWTGNFGFLGTSQTYTLADDLTVNGVTTIQTTTTGTLNGFNFYAKGTVNITNTSIVGTTNLFLTGTGTLNCNGGSSILGLNTTINTSGTITFGANGLRLGASKTFTYVSGTVVATTPVYVMQSCTLNLAGIAFNNFQINGTSTVCTLLSDITINGELRFNGATVCTVNGFNLLCYGSVYIQPGAYSVNGTTVINLVGTGSWTHQTTNSVSLPIVINTIGTITFSGSGLRIGGGTSLVYTAGTLAGSNFLSMAGSRILDLNTSVWQYLINTASATITLLSDLNLSGNFTQTGGGTVVVNGLYNIYISGDLTRNTNTTLTGTATFVLNGTGTWSDLYPAQTMSVKLIINTSGTITISGIVRMSANFSYVTGTVITTGSQINMPSAITLDVDGIDFNIILFNGGVTRTLLSNLRCNTLQVTGAASTTNGFNIYFNSLVYNTTAGSISLGTTNYIFNGTGTWTHSTTGRFNNNLIIDCGAGTLTVTGPVYISNGSITHLSGTVNQTSGSLTLAGSSIIKTSGIEWLFVYMNGSTNTFNETFRTKTLSSNGFSVLTFAGTHGFEVENFLVNSPISITITLVNGVRYLVKNSFVSNAIGYTRSFTCASGAALLDLQYGATQNVANTSATRINSLGGQTIYTNVGTLTSTQNWNVGTYVNPSQFLLMF